MSTHIRKDEPGMAAFGEHVHVWENPGDVVEVHDDEFASQLKRIAGFSEVNPDGSDIVGDTGETEIPTEEVEPALDAPPVQEQIPPGRSRVRKRTDGGGVDPTPAVEPAEDEEPAQPELLAPEEDQPAEPAEDDVES